MIRFDNVTKYYGNNKALNNINLHVNHGEFISLVGMSGAGKSTLMKILIGEEMVDDGRILIDEIDMSKVKDYDELCTDMTELIISLLKKRNLKDYICKTYTNINDNEKESVYLEALGLLEKKQNLIKETIYNVCHINKETNKNNAL